MSPKAGHSHRRRRVYVDGQLQGRLVAALVLLEAGLLVLACLYLYHAFGEIIDESLYVIHAVDRRPLLPRLAAALGWTVLVCALVNTAALVVADAIWSSHVRKVLATLRARLASVRALDLRPRPAEGKPAHRLLALTERWIASERQRLVAAREAATGLISAPESGADTRESLESALRALRRGRRADRN